jgi:hypothetical protein
MNKNFKFSNLSLATDLMKLAKCRNGITCDTDIENANVFIKHWWNASPLVGEAHLVRDGRGLVVFRYVNGILRAGETLGKHPSCRQVADAILRCYRDQAGIVEDVENINELDRLAKVWGV